METGEILELYDRFERREAECIGCRREVSGTLTRLVGVEPGAPDFVVHSKLSERDADAAIEAELAYFRGLGRDFEWKLYSYDRPADLKERLARHGFRIGGDEALMALELDALPPRLRGLGGHDVRKVVDERGIEDFAAVDAEAWPARGKAWMEALAATLRSSPARVSAWVAYVEGRPVGAARVEFPPRSPFAGVWGGATLEPYRGRGIYSALLAARAAEAIARGYRFLAIDAGPMSRPIVGRLGFRLLAISNPCESPEQ